MLKLIIVDDEKAARDAIYVSVDWAKNGIEVIGVCKNGAEAYEMLLDNCPDIVLTDIMMPGMNGLELVANAYQANMNIEFIILSGYAEFNFAKEAMRWGVKHYLLKPCDSKQIEEVLHAAIDDIRKNRTATLPSSQLIQYIFSHFDKPRDSKENSHDDIFLQEVNCRITAIRDSQTLRMILVGLLFHQKRENQSYLIAEIKEIINNKDHYSLQDLQTKIMSELHNLIENTKRTVYTGYIDTIMEYVNENLDKPQLSLRWLAENYLFMSADYLSHQFIKQTGEKFSAYLTRKRVEKAQELMLSNRAMKVYEIAEAVGCGDYPQYFSQIFKNVTGQTPSEYLKSINER